VRVYADFEAMRREEHPAMAIVTVPGVEAPERIRPVLDAGVPVLAEKPGCVDPADFADLVAVAASRGVPLMLALCNRIAPWAEDVRRLVREGGIGRLYAARVMTLADQARIWDVRTRDWTFRKAEVGGGHLLWLGIHWLDLLLAITGARVEAVQAMTGVVGGAPIDVEDLATVNLRLAGGAQASLVSGYVLGADAPKQIDLSLWGADGWVRFDSLARKVDWHGTSPALREAQDRELRYSSSGGGYTPFVRECLRASHGEAPPPVTGEEGLEVLRVIFAAYESAASGRTVTL
jgi:predicted dehydrogenase